MPDFINSDVMDNGLNELINNADVQHVLSAYAQGDDYATVIANSIGSVGVTAGDFTLQDWQTYNREAVVAAKEVTATVTTSPTPNLHVALVDSVAQRVLAVTDEDSDQPITSGNAIDVPSYNVRLAQP